MKFLILPDMSSATMHFYLTSLLIHIIYSQSEIYFQVVEEGINNSIIGNVHQQVFKHNGGVTSTDYTYKPVANIDPFFLDPRTSELKTVKRVDRESLCQPQFSSVSSNIQNCKFNFKVIQTRSTRKESNNNAEDSPPQIVEVTIEILDINDNPPKWSNQKVHFELPEHSSTDSRLALPLAIDPDQAPMNTTKRYAIIHQSVKDGFVLKHNTQDKRKESLWLVVNKDFDREVQTSINVKIEAYDGASIPLSGELEINISLTDINDKAPRFITKNNHNLITENIPLRTVVFKLKAHDDDESDQQHLKFQFDNSVDEIVKNRFYINPNTGEIFTAGYIDYEMRSEYSIPVTVTDGKHLDRTTVILEVENVNDNPPEIIVFYVSGSNFKTPRQSSSYRANIAENKDPGFVIASFSVADKDYKTTANQVHHLPLDCKLEPSGEGLDIKQLSKHMKDHYQIVTSKRFDREQSAQHFTHLICFDREAVPLSTSVAFEVHVTDVNDNAPLFKEPSPNTRGIPSYTIKEDSPVGTIIVQVKAIDVDVGANANVQYSLDTMSTKYFNIDSLSGELRSSEVFDFEKIEKYELTINASNSIVDKSNPILFTLQKIIVQVEDINDCAPIFSMDLYNFNVTEGQSKDLLVGRVDAKDDDVSKSFHTNYFEMTSGINDFHPSPEQNPQRYFRVSETGFIYVTVPILDREKISSFSFKVLASDKSDKPLSSTAIVQIRIIDLNDNPPQWIFPSTHSYTVNVSYQEPVGHCIAQLKTSDPDLGDNGKVMYRIVPSISYSPLHTIGKERLTDGSVTVQPDKLLKKHDLFDLDSTTGNIYIAQKLTVSDVGLKAVWIEARDLGSPPLKTHERLLVYIINSNSAEHESPRGGSNRKRGISRAGFENDLMIMIVLVAIIILVAMVMVIIILMLRCRNAGRLMHASKFCREACQVISTNRSMMERRPDGHSCSPINDMCPPYPGPKRSHTISTYLGQSAGSSQMFDLSTDYLTDPSSRMQMDADCCEPVCHSMTRIPVCRVNNNTFAKKYYTSSTLYRPNALWSNETSPDLSKRLCKRLNNDNEIFDQSFATSPMHSEPSDGPNERSFISDFPTGNGTKKSITLPNFLTAIDECEDANVNALICDEPMSTFKSQNGLDKSQNRLSVTWLDKCPDTCVLSHVKKQGMQYKSADSCLNTPNLSRAEKREHEYTQLNVLPNEVPPEKFNPNEYPVTYV